VTEPREPRKPMRPSELPLPPREDTSAATSSLPLGPWTVRVAKHTQGERKELLQLVQDRTPQPLAVFQEKLAVVTDPDAKRALIDRHIDDVYLAEKLWPPAWLSQEFLDAILSPGTLPDALEIALRRHNAETATGIKAFIAALFDSEQNSEALAEQAVQVMMRFLFGAKVTTKSEVTGDPKGQPPDGGMNGSDSPATISMSPSASTTDSDPTSLME
jgi:hypothetical protein